MKKRYNCCITIKVKKQYIVQNIEKHIDKFDENNPPERYDNVLFTNENEAKKYVDWLNKKEEKENK